MSRAKHAKIPEGARVFGARIVITEDGVSLVETWEEGSPNVTTNVLPAGEIGLREGLRVAGNQIRGAYFNKQRELELRERKERVRKNREAIQAERLKARIEASGKKEVSGGTKP